jgi:hypothetical protein
MTSEVLFMLNCALGAHDAFEAIALCFSAESLR